MRTPERLPDMVGGLFRAASAVYDALDGGAGEIDNLTGWIKNRARHNGHTSGEPVVEDPNGSPTDAPRSPWARPTTPPTNHE